MVHDTYGEVYGPTGSSQTVFGFTGEETDGTGLINLRARYYNPALGIFPSLDEIEGSDDIPMSLNRYAYVQGNVVNGAVGELGWHNPYAYANGDPVNLVDPSGMIATFPNNTCLSLPNQQVTDDVSNAILSSTVVIMGGLSPRDKDCVNNYDPNVCIAFELGLGTIIGDNGRILSHDHYGTIKQDAAGLQNLQNTWEWIEFRGALGNLVVPSAELALSPESKRLDGITIFEIPGKYLVSKIGKVAQLLPQKDYWTDARVLTTMLAEHPIVSYAYISGSHDDINNSFMMSLAVQARVKVGTAHVNASSSYAGIPTLLAVPFVGEMPRNGDSGGGTFRTVDGKVYLAGVNIAANALFYDFVPVGS